jgi:hypothetical protein
MSVNLYFTQTSSSVLRISGEDAKSYLQGQCTADLRQGTTHHALWLNRKGRLLAYTFIIAQPEGAWLLVSPSTPADELSKIVSSNLIADDVHIADETSQWQTGVLWGDGLPDADKFILVPTDGYGVKAWNVLGPSAASVPWPTASREALEEMRIGQGVPSVPEDCGLHEFPQECGLDAWVSYTKGCYLGQEVMARIQSMGSLRRILRCVKSDSGDLTSGQELRSADGVKVVGVIKSVSGSRGLALVSIDLAEGALLFSPRGEARLGKVAQLGSRV